MSSSVSDSTVRSSVDGIDSVALTPGGLPERDPEACEHRGEFHSKTQYMLTCIGYAVGLGNIWRFP
ncbi:hypothetical protein PMAYCL1PPCAC_28179, partial [Pristionchus mayeri]